MPELSIFIPVYNEERLIEKNTSILCSHLDSKVIDYEILIVDNGSNDKTSLIGKKLNKVHKRVRFFSIKENGVGNAFCYAIPLFSSQNVITLDMDLSTDLGFIPIALDHLKSGKDIVVGSKQTGKQNRNFFRLMLSSGYITLSRVLLDTDFSDYSLAAKAYRLDVLKRYCCRFDQGSNYVHRILAYGTRDNLKIIEIPVDCSDNRKSRFNLYKETIYRAASLMRISIGR